MTSQASRLSIELTSGRLRSALLSQHIDWSVAAVITDRIDSDGPATVRLIPCGGLPAQVAVAAVRNNEIRAALTFAEISQIGPVLQTVGRGISCLTEGVIHNALSMAHLSDRQIAIVKLLALGMSNEFIAEAAHMSLSTLKRELRTLRRMTGCDDRISVIGRLGLDAEAPACAKSALCGRSLHACVNRTEMSHPPDHVQPAGVDLVRLEDRPKIGADSVLGDAGHR